MSWSWWVFCMYIYNMGFHSPRTCSSPLFQWANHHVFVDADLEKQRCCYAPGTWSCWTWLHPVGSPLRLGRSKTLAEYVTRYLFFLPDNKCVNMIKHVIYIHIQYSILNIIKHALLMRMVHIFDNIWIIWSSIHRSKWQQQRWYTDCHEKIIQISYTVIPHVGKVQAGQFDF